MMGVRDFVENQEPVAVSKLVTAVLAMMVAFGLDFSAEQTAAIVVVAEVVAGVLVRARVTPVGTVDR